MTENSLVIEQKENRLAANKSLVFGVLAIIVFLIDMFGIFYVPKEQIGLAFAIWVVLIAAIQVIARIPSIAQKEYCKFIIVSLVFLITLTGMTILNFHAIPLLCFPMVIALNYHSSKVSHLTFILTIICAFLWPILGVIFKIWDVSYFLLLIDAIDSTLVKGTVLEKYILVGDVDWKDIFLFISLPQMGFATVFGVIIRISNHLSRKEYDARIKELDDSRDKILAGMADIVENRDLSTGDHIRRTSEVVKMLVASLPIDENGKKMMDDEYAYYVVKTAPLHDLGKIAVPDAILNKHGRLTAGEFEYIKLHPKKSVDIIDSIFTGLKDDKLTKVAKNIAYYHHEKYDGTGYPEGVKGDIIPLEARIMAIADVYDALVSERVYKDPISHEQAYWIIKDSLGSHFDPKLWPAFDKAYPQIVAYYKTGY